MAETESNVCSICLESIDENADRGMARLGCKHFFHLGEMVCPNCRVIEHGQWLYSGAESLQPQEEQQEERQREQPPLQLLLEYIHDVLSNQQPEQLEQLLNDIHSNIEDPQGHFHLVMPTGHYWCPNGGFHLHPPLPLPLPPIYALPASFEGGFHLHPPLQPPRPPPPPALPVRPTYRFDPALDYHNQLRARIGFGPRDRQVRRLNYEPVILSHRNSGAARYVPYPVRQQHQSNNFPSPALDMLNRPTRRPSLESIYPPRTSSHQQWLPGSHFQRQPIGSCPFPTRGRWILQGDLFVLQFNN